MTDPRAQHRTHDSATATERVAGTERLADARTTGTNAGTTEMRPEVHR
ncbi:MULTISPECIES: hypothetical protein [Halorussus]|nr:hypothetical protein [Halorussus vallis]USZ76975.1 hypothetical protein NGM07_06505 [Halorussus vallis]